VLRVKRVDAGHVWLSPLYPADVGAGAMWPRELAGELGTYLGVPYLREGPAWSAYPDEVPAVFAEHLAQTTEVQLAAAHRLLKTKPWDLFAVVDPIPDRVEHAYWREHAAAPGLDPERIARHRERVRAAYRDADRHLGELVAHGAPAWVVVVSAHGFGSAADDARGDHASLDRGEHAADGRGDHASLDRGDHAANGMLVVAGPGLRGDSGEIPLVDVAPTIACLLGLPGDGMVGTTLAAVRATHPTCR
jgi:predicted AlkP superfamily phosphohydrolase/phosphomutase